MDQEISIQAQPKTDDTVQFTVDRPICPDGAIRFDSREAAAGSPLAEELFAIENVGSVHVRLNSVTITTVKPVTDWLPIARATGVAIRSHLQSDGPLFADSVEVEPLAASDQLIEQVRELLDKEINPAVAAHGGKIEVLDIKDATVFIRMAGGCQGCGMADVTLKQGVEKLIRERFPEVEKILDTTDHASGQNPFFAPSK